VTIGNNFYNLNSTRGYPLDDLATGLSTDGTLMPNGLIVDMALHYPRSKGKYAFLSAVHVSKTNVSVAISAGDDLDAATLNPIATLVLSQPVSEGRAYQLTGLAPGIAGWVVFGNLANNEYSGSFATPRQGLLLSGVGRSYLDFPVPWASKPLDEYKLQDVVKLIAGRDLEIVRTTRPILGEDRDCIVFRLTGDPNVILPKYVGPCGVRPESDNCIKPPIQAINEVVPDADGNIQMSFPDMTVINLPHGLLLNTDLSLPAICPITPVTDEPDQNFCDSAISDDSISHSISHDDGGPSDSGTSSPGGESSSSVLVPTYPHCVRFYSNLPAPFTAKAGSWNLANFDEFNYVRCTAIPGELSSQRRMMFSPYSTYQNINVFNDPAYMENVNLEIQTVMRTNTLEDAKIGLVLDYRRVGELTNMTAVFLDFKTQQFTIQRMAAGLWLTPAVAVNLSGTGSEFTHVLSHNIWYNLKVQIRPSVAAGRVDIFASFFNANHPLSPPEIVRPDISATAQVLSMSGFGINTGQYGYFSQGSNTYFTHLYLNSF